jgi:hypothetical protein
MPVEPVVRGFRVVYEVVDWPAACRLVSKPVDQLSDDEIKAELALLDAGNENVLHQRFCTNVSCPSKR